MTNDDLKNLIRNSIAVAGADMNNATDFGTRSYFHGKKNAFETILKAVENPEPHDGTTWTLNENDDRNLGVVRDNEKNIIGYMSRETYLKLHGDK